MADHALLEQLRELHEDPEARVVLEGEHEPSSTRGGWVALYLDPWPMKAWGETKRAALEAALGGAHA